MKYVYWGLISIIVAWELHALKDIFNYSVGLQLTLNIVLVIYFGYLLDIPYSRFLTILYNKKSQ
ncbi:hypothetical protein SAMN05421734_1148 [Pelagirhabdus alkalitolerans]|uniref:Uncharacterized protein n=1 Tax=Pelagirhabdus alkalitolerans TaxID=1612202 RepID=A0A1G6N3J0_9BACI|nr:hypothetical protein [Pelagirhabdus alkalitolerans]SDC62409.1 hypothetical protein SAMN05421734_1148 [Pelagirhabdus alkalitolerans]